MSWSIVMLPLKVFGHSGQSNLSRKRYHSAKLFRSAEPVGRADSSISSGPMRHGKSESCYAHTIPGTEDVITK